MKPILTRCGFRCDLCLAYKPNIEVHPENRRKLSDGWHKYFDFRLQPAFYWKRKETCRILQA